MAKVGHDELADEIWMEDLARGARPRPPGKFPSARWSFKRADDRPAFDRNRLDHVLPLPRRSCRHARGLTRRRRLRRQPHSTVTSALRLSRVGDAYRRVERIQRPFREGIQPSPHQRLSKWRSGAHFHAGRAYRCFTAQALVARYPPGISYNRASGRLSWRICFSLQSPPLSPARTALPQAYATRCSHPAYSVQTLAFQPAEANHSRLWSLYLGSYPASVIC